jgi:hypothetical protein
LSQVEFAFLTSPGRETARDADADARQILTANRSDQGAREPDDGVQRRLIVATRRRDAAAAVFLAVGRQRERLDLCSSKVDADAPHG